MFEAPRSLRPDRNDRKSQTAPRQLTIALRREGGLFPGWGPHL